jgi:hypothetical protein
MKNSRIATYASMETRISTRLGVSEVTRFGSHQPQPNPPNEPRNQTHPFSFLFNWHHAFSLGPEPNFARLHAYPSARVFNGRLYTYPAHDLSNMKHWDEVNWHVFSTDDIVKPMQMMRPEACLNK